MRSAAVVGLRLALLLVFAAMDPARAETGDRPPSPAPVSGAPAAEEVEGAEISTRLQERGRALYALYCADCHGPAGRGDGAAAAGMTPPPSDLTLMSRRAGGQFPLLEAYAIIDGRSRMGGHQQGSMPVWGLRFQELNTDANQADEIRGRILQLLHYLRSIQVVEGGDPEP